MADTLTRAFELARDDDCRSIREIEKRLIKEGYEHVPSHLSGASIRKQLNALINEKSIFAASFSGASLDGGGFDSTASR